MMGQVRGVLLAFLLAPGAVSAQASESVRVGFTIPIVTRVVPEQSPVIFQVTDVAAGQWTAAGNPILLEHQGNVDQAIEVDGVALSSGPTSSGLADIQVQLRVGGGDWRDADAPGPLWVGPPGARTGSVVVHARIRGRHAPLTPGPWALEVRFANLPAGG